MRISSHIWMLLLLILGLPVTALSAVRGLEGDVAFSYGTYQVEESGRTTIEAHHFSQQYSLLYRLGGQFLGGRGGKYDLAFGYEWTGLNGQVEDRSVGRNLVMDTDVKTGKFLFRGNTTIAPGGLPFRLTAFSHDMQRTLLVEDTNLPSRAEIGGTFYTGSILKPNIFDDVVNGQRIQSGATLLVGIRNGSYLGRYRDVLSQLPRLLFDFREFRVRDLKSNTPTHYLDRNLAFVSLNKKDNWFHFRYHDFQDYIDPDNDYIRKSLLLGTIDHRQTRQWINLTNWIRVSADGSYSIEDFADDALNNDNQRYDLNLFALADRSDWNASTFASYQRIRDEFQLERNLDVPIFAEGELNRDTAWRSQLIGERTDFLPTVESNSIGLKKDVVYGALQVEMRRRAKFVIVPKVEAEFKSGNQGEGYSERIGVEAYSNSAFQPVHRIYGQLTLGRWDGTTSDGTDENYWEGTAVGRLVSRWSAAWETGLEERLVYGDGAVQNGAAEHLRPSGTSSLLESNGGPQKREGTTLRSTSRAHLSHSTAWRLKNRLEVIYDTLSSDNTLDGGRIRQSQTVFRHRLDLDRRQWYVRMRNEFITGDDIENQSLTTQSTTQGLVQQSDATFTHDSRIHYGLGRMLEINGNLIYDWRNLADGGDASHVGVSQDATYSFYVVNGLVRKVAEITEELNYEKFSGFSQGNDSVLSLLGGVNWFPKHNLLLGAKLRYRMFELQDQNEFSYFLTAGVSYAKLRLMVDYAYGDRTSGADGLGERVEHRFQATVQKIF